jgi:hypothetical protein
LLNKHASCQTLEDTQIEAKNLRKNEKYESVDYIPSKLSFLDVTQLKGDKENDK